MYKAAAIQMKIEQNDPAVNRAKAIRMAEEAARAGAELIVFPELWSSGYFLSKEQFLQLAERPNGDTVAFFREYARKWNAVLVVPYPEIDGDKLHISLAVIERNGDVVQHYRKSFIWGREQAIFDPGERNYDPVVTSVGTIGVLICYDIEFPEPSRLLALKGAELIIVPSVWSIGAEPRWDIQLPARALDNTVFVLGVNTVGDGTCGKSKLVAPDGEVLSECPRDQEAVLVHEVDPAKIPIIREKIPYLADYDEALLPGGKQRV